MKDKTKNGLQNIIYRVKNELYTRNVKLYGDGHVG
jgi:hypothetical protein